ncbi:SAUR family [Musa troglodytarum]|uniref:SAUR family n=1 Tax=Musa troglodytarum TaxID=320322 RepID=A0A9E7G158_9LILI|nr:SAUR family [Musa troglodytarum]
MSSSAGRPAFLELLRLSSQEYGYEQQGVLRIPFPAPLFRRLLLLLRSRAGGALPLPPRRRSSVLLGRAGPTLSPLRPRCGKEIESNGAVSEGAALRFA